MKNNMKYLKQINSNQGFTVVELTIATAVFAIVLLIVSMSLLQIGKTYYKGITSAQTQDASRSIIDSLAQSIQFSDGSVSGPSATSGTNTYYICAGQTRYTYVVGKQLTDNVPSSDQTKTALLTDTFSGSCNNPLGFPTSNITEQLSPSMRIALLQICTPGDVACPTPTPANSGLYSITIRVVYGDRDLLCSPAIGDCSSLAVPPLSEMTAADLSCKKGIGSQFCAVSQLSTTVQARSI
jgi:prepilin-type N-terminal cleavage/methylation domain-containing protein